MQDTVTVRDLPICRRLRKSVLFTGRSCTNTFTDCSGIGRARLTSPTSFFDTTGTGRLDGTTPRRMVTLLSDYVTHYRAPVASSLTPCLLRHTRVCVGMRGCHLTLTSCSTCFGTIGNDIGSLFCCCHRRTTFGTGRFRHTLSSVTGTVRLGPRSLACHTRRTIMGLHMNHCRRTRGMLGSTLTVSPGCTRKCHLLKVYRVRLGRRGTTYTDFTGTGRLKSPGMSRLVGGRYGWAVPRVWGEENYHRYSDLFLFVRDIVTAPSILWDLNLVRLGLCLILLYVRVCGYIYLPGAT